MKYKFDIFLARKDDDDFENSRKLAKIVVIFHLDAVTNGYQQIVNMLCRRLRWRCGENLNKKRRIQHNYFFFIIYSAFISRVFFILIVVYFIYLNMT